MGLASANLIIKSGTRAFPRLPRNLKKFILLEMICHKNSKFLKNNFDFVYGIRDLNLSIKKGEKVAILGLPKSGKSTLAGVASGLLGLNSGYAEINSDVQLIRKPSSGFKTILTFKENLHLLGLLNEFQDIEFKKVLTEAFFSFKLNDETLNQSSGNIPAQLIRDVSCFVTLSRKSEMTVYDDFRVGNNPKNIELFNNKINSETSIFITSSLKHADNFEIFYILQEGKILGPYNKDLAINKYNHLINKYLQTYSDSVNDLSDSFINEMRVNREIEKFIPWVEVINVYVNDVLYKHSNFSLIQNINESLTVKMELSIINTNIYSGGKFVLYAGNTGFEVANYFFDDIPVSVEKNKKFILNFEFKFPQNLNESFYGLNFIPRFKNKFYPLNHKLKILIFGTKKKYITNKSSRLNISNIEFFEKIPK